MLDGKMEEIGGFFQCIRAVRNHHARHFRVLAKNRIYACCELQPDGGIHILAADIGDLLDTHVCVILDFRYGVDLFRTQYRTRLVFGETGGRAPASCYGTSCGQHHHQRQLG